MSPTDESRGVREVAHEEDVELEDDWDGEQFLNFPQTKLNAATQTAAVQHALHSSGLSNADIKKLDLLEAGCGPGAVTLHLAPLFATLTAVETSPNMLKVLHRQLVEAGLENTVQYALHPLSPSSPDAIRRVLPSPTADHLRRKVELEKTRFDVAVVNTVLHHVDNIEPFLEGLIGLIKPGGHVVFTEFDGEEAGIRLHEMHDPETGEFGFRPYPHWFDQNSIREVLQKAGLQDVKADIHGRLRGEGGESWIDCMVAWGRVRGVSGAA